MRTEQILEKLKPARVVKGLHWRARALVWWLRWKHRPHLHYYRHMMDKLAGQSPRDAVGGMWEEIGSLQFEFLKQQGLHPGHTLLDIGCGSLRGGRHFIRYLEPGNYGGLDISPTILDAGHRILGEEGLECRRPSLLLTEDFQFIELKGRRFDFILAFGVFPDIPAKEISECFQNLHKAMFPNSVLFATFRLGDQHRADRRAFGFVYPLSFFEELGHRTGYSVELVTDFQHPRGHHMLSIRPLTRTA